MRKATLIAGVVLVAILCAGRAALGQGPEQGQQIFGRGEMREGGFGGPLAGHRMAGLMAILDNDRVKASLNLTDQQVDRLRQILVDTEKASVKMRADMAVRGIELRELLRADKADHDAVMSKVGELSDLRGQMMKQHVEALLAAKALLTPEQQKKMRSFIENRAAFGGTRERLGERREGWGTRRPEAAPRPPTPPVPPAHPGEPPVQ